MSYRDEEEAKLARIDALEDQVEELRAENEKLRTAATAPEARHAELPTAGDAERRARAARAKREGRLFLAGTLLGIFIFPAVALYLPIAFGHDMPSSFGLGFPSMIGILVGGALVPSSFLRIVLPAVPIMTKDEHAGMIQVDRPMRLRKIFFGLATFAYFGGAIGWWICTTPH